MDIENRIFWEVKSVSSYELFFDSGIKENDEFHRTYDLVKNLAYNVQYLEFISNSFKLEIHSVIRTELIKTFVITGISIIESILYYVLKSQKLHKSESYEEITVLSSNEKKVNNDYLKVETRLLKKLDEKREVVMNLDFMLKKTESYKLLGADNSVYKQLNHLRKLRNKIHLYLIESNLDHDLNNFKLKELILMKKTLSKVFLADLFNYPMDKKEKIFNFLETVNSN